MTLVTLIGEKLAKEGNEFTYLGPQNDCKNCKLKTVCFNLKTNRNYKITKIRDKKHSCNVHEGNAAVIEVQELPIFTSIEDIHNEGDKIKIEKNNCNNIGCEFYDLCSCQAIIRYKTYKITKIYEKIKCPIGYNLQKAELTD